jgi:hypothetical protein
MVLFQPPADCRDQNTPQLWSYLSASCHQIKERRAGETYQGLAAAAARATSLPLKIALSPPVEARASFQEPHGASPAWYVCRLYKIPPWNQSLRDE